jgi:hypothetical protein
MSGIILSRELVLVLVVEVPHPLYVFTQVLRITLDHTPKRYFCLEYQKCICSLFEKLHF